MRLLLSKLRDFDVVASDGDVGPVTDVFFDDRRWVVRYLVVEPRRLERDAALVISPIGIAGVDPDAGVVTLDLDRDRLERSPGLELHEPVSAQREREYYRFFGWQYYWQGQGLWGRLTTPAGLAAVPPPAAAEGPVAAQTAGVDVFDPAFGDRQPGPADEEARRREAEGEQDRHLRSFTEVKGYGVEAADGSLGHVEDLEADLETWSLPCVVVDTAPLWFGKKVAVATEHARAIDWARTQVVLDLTREQVRSSPEYDPPASA